MKRQPVSGLLDAYVLLLITGAVALGTVMLRPDLRLAIIWATLALGCVVYLSLQPIQADLSLSKVGRGALLGAVISLPILALLPDELRLFAERLFLSENPVTLFYHICFVAAPLQEIVFRGIVWEQKGQRAALILFLALIVLLFAPHVPLVVTLILLLGYGLMAVVLGYVREQHGLAAAVACHVVAGLLLLVMPALIAAVRLMLA